LPNVIKIDPYNFELYRFKVCALFLRHSVYHERATVSQRRMLCKKVQFWDGCRNRIMMMKISLERLLLESFKLQDQRQQSEGVKV